MRRFAIAIIAATLLLGLVGGVARAASSPLASPGGDKVALSGGNIDSYVQVHLKAVTTQSSGPSSSLPIVIVVAAALAVIIVVRCSCVVAAGAPSRSRPRSPGQT